MPPMHLRTLKLIAAVAATLWVSGCATFSADGGIDSVSALTQARTGQAVRVDKSSADHDAIEAKVSLLFAAPLSADTAVQIALMNNKGLQAAFAELGAAEADLVQAGRLRNPGFSFSRLRNGDDVEIERSIVFDLVGLLTMPLRSDIEGRRFEQAKLQAASDAVRLAAETRRAYFHALASQQTVQFMQQVKTSAEAGAQLAQRMAKVGNFSKLDYAREQVFYADANTQLARAMHAATAAREQLARLLGLWDSKTAFTLPNRLPDLPGMPKDGADFESQAMRQRLDVQIAKSNIEATAQALGLTQATRFINVLDAGYVNKSETGKPRANGYEVRLEIPLFDWNSRTRKAESQYMASVHRTADIATRARAEVREAYSAYRTTYDIAKHYRDEVVPLRKQIADEVLLRYNGMLTGVFELLAEARAQANSVNAAIESQRDFWLAETDLQNAINGSGGLNAATGVRTRSAADDAAGGH
ncbi:TolC family protein [soil metagenome]